jgi:hypothetical protein
MFFVVGLQRFYSVKACPKEMKCDVEVSCFGMFVLLSVFNLLSLSDGMLAPMSNIYMNWKCRSVRMLCEILRNTKTFVTALKIKGLNRMKRSK